jgi:hypothetical protein
MFNATAGPAKAMAQAPTASENIPVFRIVISRCVCLKSDALAPRVFAVPGKYAQRRCARALSSQGCFNLAALDLLYVEDVQRA